MIYFILLDTKYDPELVGKYHTDAFNTLKEKYENSIGGSSTSSEVMKDMKEILTDYCPSNDANPMNACMNTISEYAEKNHGDKIHGRLLKSVFSEDQLQILEDAITSMDNKKDALEAIRSLKEGLDQNDTKERAVVAALSVAEESFSLWHDVLNDENHVFHLKDKNGVRKLQACLSLLELVRADEMHFKIPMTVLPRFMHSCWQPILMKIQYLNTLIDTSCITYLPQIDSNDVHHGKRNYPMEKMEVDRSSISRKSSLKIH